MVHRLPNRLVLQVRGDDFAEIRQAVEALKAELAAIDGVTDISDDDTSGQRVLSVAINSDALQRARISPAQLSRTLRLLVDGEVVASLRDLGEEIDVRVRAQRSQLNSIDELLQTDIPSAGGGLVSLSTLLDAEYTTGQDSINHYNFRRAIIIEADIDATKANTIAVNNRVKDVWKNELQRQFPSIDLDFSGLLDDIQDSIQAMIVLFGLGMGLIYIILGTQFKSYFQPLLILCTVPMAFAGVLTGLLFNGNPLSLYTLLRGRGLGRYFGELGDCTHRDSQWSPSPWYARAIRDLIRRTAARCTDTDYLTQYHRRLVFSSDRARWALLDMGTYRHLNRLGAVLLDAADTVFDPAIVQPFYAAQVWRCRP